MIEVKHPTAGIVQFPDNTSEAEMREAMAILDRQELAAKKEPARTSYTPDEIRHYAMQLGAKGAPPAEIEQFVAAASQDMAQQQPAAKPATPIPIPRNPRTGLPDLRDLSKMEGAVGFMKSAGLVGGGAAAGQVIGAGAGPLAPVTVPALGFLGGGAGSLIDQMTDNTPGISWGRVAGDALAGAIPGGNIAAAGGKQLVKEGLKQGVGNVAATALQVGIDEKRMPTVSEGAGSFLTAQVGLGGSKLLGGAHNAKPERGVRTGDYEAIEAMRKLGVKDSSGKVTASVVVDPASLHDESSPLLKSFAGRSALGQQASIVNADALHAAAREAIGLSATAHPIKPSVIKAVIRESWSPYKRIAALSPEAAENLNKLKRARAGANAEMEKIHSMAPGASHATYQEYLDEAVGIEAAIAKEAKAKGGPDLVKELKDARKRIAQSYQLLSAVSLNGVLDARKLSEQMRAGAPLTDNLEKIARFASAVERDVVPVNKVGDPSINHLDAHGVSRGITHAALDSMATMAGAPKARKLVRGYFLSPEFQQSLIDGSTEGQERFAAAVARMAALQAGRVNSYLHPESVTLPDVSR